MVDKQIAGKDVLAVPMQDNDAEAETVGGYLKALMRVLWEEEDGFSGKRPFGNSGWQNEIFTALVKAGLVTGTWDADGYLDDADEDECNRLVFLAIDALA